MRNIIDFDDMVSNGLIKDAETFEIPKDDPIKGNQKFAVVLKTASGKEIPKFNITTKHAVENAIFAINKNTLPIEIVNPAKYYIKQAATHFGIDVNWKTEKHDRIVEISSLEKEAEDVVHYRVKIGNSIFSLNSLTNIKLAEECFLGSLHNITIPSRQRVACAIIKEASIFPFIPNIATKIWSSPTLGDKVASEINFRKKIKADNNEYIELIDKYASVSDKMEPVNFIEAIRRADKIANFIPHNYGKDYSLFTEKTPVKTASVDFDKIVKEAMLTTNPEFLNLVY